MSNHEEEVKDPAGVVKPLSESAVDGVEIADEGAEETSEITKRAKLVERLQDGREFILATAITRDYFASRTLGEQIRRRIAAIGDRQGYAGNLGLESFSNRETLSLQQELSDLKEQVLMALEDAKKLLKDLE